MNKEELNYIKKRLTEEKLIIEQSTPYHKEWAKGYNGGIRHSIRIINEIFDEMSKTESASPSEVKVCPFLTNNGTLTYCTNGVISTDKTVLSCCKCSAWTEGTSIWWAPDNKYVTIPGHCKRLQS